METEDKGTDQPHHPSMPSCRLPGGDHLEDNDWGLSEEGAGWTGTWKQSELSSGEAVAEKLIMGEPGMGSRVGARSSGS